MDSDATTGDGQVTLSAFLAGLAPELEAIATSELAPIGLTAAACPYIPYWLGYYSRQTAAHVEGVIARFAAPQVITPSGLHEALVQRLRRAVRLWVESGGAVVDVPEGINVGDGSSDSSASGSGGLLAKMADGSTAMPTSSDPAAVQARLGEGQPLSGPVRDRMERGFGESFADVRLHTDAGAARLAGGFSARAFTVGPDVAFARGEYRPGTIPGDALIAHELAHVVQQRGRGSTSGPEAAALEDNADQAAAAVVGLTAAELELDPQLLRRPQLARHGLQLQRCSRSEPPVVAPELLQNAPLTTMSDQQLVDRFDRLVAAERALRVWLQGHTSATADANIATLVAQAELLAQELARRHTPQPGESQRTFSPQAANRMRGFFERNVASAQPLACINTVRSGLGELYDAGASGTPASVTRGLKMSANNTMEETMAQMQKQKLAGPVQEIYFADQSGAEIRRGNPARPVRLSHSIWDAIITAVGADANYSVFGLSLLDGYHSITVTVDSRIPGRPRVFWSDQTSRHDTGWEEYQRGASGHASAFQSGSPRGLDEYIEYAVQFWWDDELKKHNKHMLPVARLWRLNQPPPPQKPTTPTKKPPRRSR